MIKQFKKLPKHIAFILDGNGRWAKKRGLIRSIGHKHGIEAVKRTILCAEKYGLEAVTLFAFSTENWKRDKDEIDEIFSLLENYIEENEQEYLDKNMKLITSGDITKLPKSLFKKIEELKEKTSKKTGLIVNICLNYGFEEEIVRAFNLLRKKEKSKISIKDIKNNLYSKDLPNLDFVVRTSGEQRLSNFMLLQCAYSELYFPKTLWPDFNEKYFIKALKEYNKRSRRFGKA